MCVGSCGELRLISLWSLHTLNSSSPLLTLTPAISPSAPHLLSPFSPLWLCLSDISNDGRWPDQKCHLPPACLADWAAPIGPGVRHEESPRAICSRSTSHWHSNAHTHTHTTTAQHIHIHSAEQAASEKGNENKMQYGFHLTNKQMQRQRVRKSACNAYYPFPNVFPVSGVIY